MDSVNEIDIVVESPKKVVSFKLDVDIIAKIDEVWPRLGYRSRSQFLREAVLFYLQYIQTNFIERTEREVPLASEDEPDGLEAGESIEEIVDELKSLVKTVSIQQ